MSITEGDDKWLTCRDCGEEFIFTTREQAFYAQKGFTNEPTRCTECRTARKRDRTMNGNLLNNNYNNNNVNNGNYNARPPMNSGFNNNNRSRNDYGTRPSANNYNNNRSRNDYGTRPPMSNGFNNNNNNRSRNDYGTRPPMNGGFNNNNNNRSRNDYGTRPAMNGGFNNNNNRTQETMQPRKTSLITCSRCGNQAEVPFTPRQGVPVFCPSCYTSQKVSNRY